MNPNPSSGKTFSREDHESDYSRFSAVKFKTIGQASKRACMKHRRDGKKYWK
jgi:hypothetical protein